ncbi:polyketide synthase [Thozetella sp. PMI_491]|nr:polyketide synthase [Thozetella sp. PMI_491]
MEPIATERVQTAVTECNTTDDANTLGLCLHELFETAVERYRNNIALVCANEELTFGDLNALANRFGRILVGHGVRNGDLVGVALDRSVHLVAALLAVLKTGATYVPIDPAFPAARINQMMEDACPKILITGDDAFELEAFASRRNKCLRISEMLWLANSESDCGNLGMSVRSNDLAYVMYTSGTTGRPKGVEISHSSVSNLLLSMQKEPGCSETDRLLAITTISFDMAVPELFLPLLCGATTVIAQKLEMKDTAALPMLMQRHAITMMQGTPAIWQMLLDSGWDGRPRLMKILCGGEALRRPLADRLLACGDMVYNIYGPTEATVYASIWKVCHGTDVIIGWPIANARLYVLDSNLSPSPLGIPGELYIGGAGVARGYRNNSELSRSRFLENPFHDGRMYRTGDLACLVAPGKLRLSGRMDGQVKVRGHRIEVGDIETTIAAHKDISSAVVVCRDDRLTAYYLRVTEHVDATASTEAPLDRLLRSWLADRLPSYMMPAFFIELEEFPITINGKIDRKALPDPMTESRNTTDMKATTELEGQLVTVWQKVLGHGRFNVHDNFFEVGGDSIRVVRVQKELETLLGRPLSSPKLFEYYSIKTLASYLTRTHDPVLLESAFQHHSANSTGDIAIISMACRLPGGITSPAEFWELLEKGGDAVTDVPEGRWDTRNLDSAGKVAQGTPYFFRGGFIPSINSFDASFFGISPREARRLDPSQYMMLETCWEGFERAGYTMERLRGSQTGVFIGTSNILAHQSLNSGTVRDLADVDGYTVTGSAGATMSGRISYHLGLEGPTLTIDTACSSSLVTTHLACSALRQGECDMAVSGGVSLMLNPGLHVEFSRLQGMSPDGRCRPFAAEADGTSWAEGSVVVVLKRLPDAQRDGDTIHGVIRGSAVNHDGRSATLTTPSGAAQRRLIHSALKAARLHPDDIDYIEAHGTGTRLGDPIEATALADVFGPTRTDKKPLLIGSAKSNLGHTQAAAGLVGLLKVVLALQHNTLPETLHAAEPTPAVDWAGASMTPVLSKRPWFPLGSQPRRAGVSAFGIGGTNAHVIIEDPPIKIAVKKNMIFRLPCALPFLLSGDTDAALRMQAVRLRQHIINTPNQDSIEDLAYSLATSRTHFQRRWGVVAGGEVELLEKLNSIDSQGHFPLSTHIATHAPRIAMLFTGQGSQWAGMGKDLFESHPIFREAINEIASQFTALEPPLLDVMWADPGSIHASLLNRTDFAQPALFALEVALWRLWQSWGVKPEFVLGHSLGELVAAHVAGVLDLSDACRLVAARGRLMQAQSGDSSMASLGASATEVATAIDLLGYSGMVDIALYNTPVQTVVSGQCGAVGAIADHFTGMGHKTKILAVGHAFHSRHMDGMLDEFRATVNTVRFRPPQLSIVSCLDGNLVEPDQIQQSDYWVKQVREPVRFLNGIQTLARQGVDIFLELGPQPVLCGMGAACLADSCMRDSIGWMPSLDSRKESASVLLNSVLNLHLRQIPINWSAYFEPFGCQRIGLPTYAFQRDQFAAPDMRPAGFAPEISNSNTHTLNHGQGRLSFEIKWNSVKLSSACPRETWGLLLPGGEGTWASVATTALSRAGIALIKVKHLEQAKGLDGMACLWDSEADVLSQMQDFVAIGLAQLQTAAESQFMPPLVWITRHAVGTGTASDDRDMRLGAGPLWGLMRTGRNEHPELHLRLIDLGGEPSPCLASALMLKAEPECAVREDRVLVPRVHHTGSTPIAPGKQRLVRTDGALLITGGLGHLGARVARWLASEHDVRDLVLTSRRGEEVAGADALVTELSKLGVRATVIASDAADPAAVASLMGMFDGNRPLRGIVHAAGVVDSGVLSTMTAERCATTLLPKAYGAWNLHQATLDMDLDLFVLFSSISGVMGMPGLANYAAANTFLDALAHFRRAQALPATSVAYGTWSGDGMGSKLAATTQSHLGHFGLDPLTPEEGLDLFREAVVSTRALTVAAALDLERLKSYYEEQGGMPPLLDSILAKTGPQASRGWGLSESLRKAEPRQQSTILLDIIREVVAKTLTFTHPLDVDVDKPLQDIGIDSLTAVQVRNHLATLTGLTLSVNMAFLHPNLRALSTSLLTQLQGSDTSSSLTDSRSETSATTTSEGPALNMDAIRKGCLDRSFTFENVAQDASQCIARPECIFLTGATGFVGAFILSELLRQGITTYCLVRADSVDAARLRLIDTLKDYGLWVPSLEPLIVPMPGDMAQPLFGLTENVFDELADRIDSICHSGALVDWMRPLEDYIAPNIISTHEILRLASRGRSKAVHHVSTISTLPLHLGLELVEGDQEYGYGTSKYIAEKMVAAARFRGAKATVYRLPYVTASTATGHFRLDRGDFLHNLIAGSLSLGVFPSLDATMSAVLPIDYLSQTIVSVMTRHQHRIGRDFDFLNTRAPTCDDFFGLMSSLGGGQEIVVFSTWKQRALDYAAAHPASSLARIASVFDRYTDETAAEMFKGLPVGENVFGGTDYPAPSLGEEFIRTYLDRLDGR